MPCLFLSHSGHDTDSARELKRRLLASPEAQRAGLEVWLDVDDLLEGKPWQAQLEAALAKANSFAVVVGSAGIHNWVRAETDLALDRAIRDEQFRVIPVLHGATSIEYVSPFARRFQAVRDPLHDPEALQRLLRAALGNDGAGLPALTDEPFPGLRSMTEAWSDRFFCRRAETDAVLGLLRRHRVVTVIADSGAGKSSLAQAGVAHAWRGGALFEDRPQVAARVAWHVLTMRPSENPLERLRDAVEASARQLGRTHSDCSIYRQALETDPAFALRCGLGAEQCRVLLVIDQAEELITLAAHATRDRFGSLISTLAERMGDRLRILVTVRSDHWNLLSTVAGFGTLVGVDEAIFRLKQPVDLAEIVRGPLALAVHRNAAEQTTLIERLRRDLSDRPGDLALAQMALSLAWRDRERHGGLLGAYAAGGGALAALGREAERVERALPPGQSNRLTPIFIRLIRLSDTSITATRRIAARDEFDADQHALIDLLAGEEYGRLLQTSEHHVEISHEALITQWPSLHQYLRDHAGELRILDDLMRRAWSWRESSRDETHLTSLADEERYQRLRQDRTSWLAPLELEYLTWCETGHARVRDEIARQAREKMQALREREQAVARAKRVVWNGIAVASVLLVLLSVAGWFAYQQFVEARLQTSAAAQSRADALVLLAKSEAQTNPVAALKLALAAWPDSPNGPFPAPAVTYAAINTAIARTLPHQVLRGHEGPVLSVAISKDGSRLLSGGSDGSLRLWDADSGSQLGEPMLGHDGRVLSVAFSHDGRRLLSGGDDGSLRLWDADSGSQLGEPMLGHDGRVLSVAFSHDSRQLLSGGRDGSLRLWDADSGAQLGEPMSGHDDWVRSVAFSHDGRRLLSGGDDGSLRLWDADSGAQLGEPMRGHDDWVRSVAFSHDGRRLLSGGDDGSLRLWDADSGAQLGEPMRSHGSGVLSVAFSHDSRRLLSSGDDGSLRLWDADSGAQLGEPMRGHEGAVLSVAFSHDGRRLLSGGDDGSLRLWDADSGAQLGEPMRGHGSGVLSVAFSHDSRQLLSGGRDGSLRLWDADSGAQLGEPMRGHEGWVRSVAFSHDSRRLLSGGDDGSLRLWDADSGAQLGEPMREHEVQVLSVAFSHDSRRLLSGGGHGSLRLWDADSGAQLGEPMRGHEGMVLSVAFSHDSRRLLSGGNDGSLRLWDADSGAQLGEPMRGHGSGVLSVAFSHDSRRLLSGGDDGSLRLWDADSGAQLGEPMSGHEGAVLSMAFSHDSRRLLSGGDDGSLQLWDADSGAQLGEPMSGHEGAVLSVAFSHDSRRLLSGGDDGSLQLWGNLPPGNILQVACRYLPSVNGGPETSIDGLAAAIGIHDLSLPSDCDAYDPPLPVESRQLSKR